MTYSRIGRSLAASSFAVMAIAIGGSLSAEPATAAGSSAAKAASDAAPHVMVVVMENREEKSVIGHGWPKVNALAKKYGLATQSYGVSHPSLPNYLALVSGSTHGVRNDGTGYSFGGKTVVDELAAKGIGWKAYMEGMPSPCYKGAQSGRYAKKHNPFMYFKSVTGKSKQCSRVVPGSQLSGDLHSGNAPDFIWFTPDLCNDGHDCSGSKPDTYAAGLVDSVQHSAWYRHNGVIILTWDEGDTSKGGGGHIATLVISEHAKGKPTMQRRVNHYGVLGTIEQLYGVPRLGSSGAAKAGNLLALTGRKVTSGPKATPTPKPTHKPTHKPTPKPTHKPTANPSASATPTSGPPNQATPAPTPEPTADPTPAPSGEATGSADAVITVGNSDAGVSGAVLGVQASTPETGAMRVAIPIGVLLVALGFVFVAIARRRRRAAA